LDGRFTETNRIHLALLVMQNRMIGPYLAAIHGILVPGMAGVQVPNRGCVGRGLQALAKMQAAHDEVLEPLADITATPTSQLKLVLDAWSQVRWMQSCGAFDAYGRCGPVTQLGYASVL
jgi:hypothetical protein